MLAQSSLKHVVLITLFSVAITHSCFTWVALTVAAFLRYLIPPQTTRSEIRLKWIAVNSCVKWNYTLGQFQFLFSPSTPHRPQTPGPVKTSNAGRDESVCGTSRQDGDAVWYAKTPVPRVVRATASAPATTPLTRASAPWGRPPALWVSSWKSNTRAPATVSRGC